MIFIKKIKIILFLHHFRLFYWMMLLAITAPLGLFA